MKISPWNIRGLGGTHWKRKRGRLRQEIHRYVTEGQIEFLLLQEHRLSKQKTEKYGSTMYEDWDHFWGQEYGAEEHVGGVCIANRGVWRQKIIHAEIITQGTT